MKSLSEPPEGVYRRKRKETSAVGCGRSETDHRAELPSSFDTNASPLFGMRQMRVGTKPPRDCSRERRITAGAAAQFALGGTVDGAIFVDMVLSLPRVVAMTAASACIATAAS